MAQADDRFVLTLFVAGPGPLSQRAITNIERVCREELAGNCELEVIDISRDPEAAEDNRILAVPTLIKRSPEPPVRLVGDLSRTDRLLTTLNITPA